MISVSERILQLVESMFPEQSQERIRELLELECADNIAGCENYDSEQMDRIRVSVLKLSEGDPDRLARAVELAQTDWRDLLMAAGFGEDADAHKRWSPD